MANGCCSDPNGETLVFACAGASHAGQVSNRVGISLTQEGVGSLFCIAAIGAGAADKMERARAAGTRGIIDGCDDHCARKIMDKAGLCADLHVELTQIGVDKKPERPQLLNDAKRAVAHVKERLAGR